MGEVRFERCFYCTPETGRHPGCQSTCEHYEKDRTEYMADQEKIRKAKDQEAITVNTAVRLREKRRREFNA